MKNLITTLRTPIAILAVSVLGLLTYTQPTSPLPASEQDVAEILEVLVVKDSASTWISRSQWTSHMQQTLPRALCENLQASNQQVGVTQQKCQDLVAVEVQICLQANDIPEQLTLPEEGSKWGSFTGECADKAYRTVVRALASKS